MNVLLILIVCILLVICGTLAIDFVLWLIAKLRKK